MEKSFESRSRANTPAAKSECTSTETPRPDNCRARVIDPRTLPECESYYRRPSGRDGFLVAKIPVVLAEFIVQVDMESDIRLEERALDIKRIKKNVFLTQCKLIPNTDKLFLRGYLRKNIEYSTVQCADRKVISGDIKHTTVKVPFECVTKVPFCIRPQFNTRFPQTEIETLDDNNMGKDPLETDFRDFEPLNEKVFCELVWAKFNEADIEGEQNGVRDNPDEFTFQTLTEKTVMYLKIKLLQVQQVNIYGYGNCTNPSPMDKPLEETQPDEDITE